MVQLVQKMLSSKYEFTETLKSVVFSADPHCMEKVGKCIRELGEYTAHDKDSFYLMINSAIMYISIGASSVKAEGVDEYRTKINNIVFAIGALFEESLKDEKVAEAVTMGLRYWQLKDVEDTLRRYREITYMRR